MTPKEKAIELVDKFRLNVVDYEGNGLNDYKGKQCALIAVDEKLETLNKIKFVIDCIDLRQDYLEVKQEIKKL
jgi:hypothetical protein